MKMNYRSFGALAVILLAAATLAPGQAFAQANLEITKTDNETVATAGETTLTYEIVVSNTGDAPIIDVSVVDTFPDSLSCGYSAASTGTNAASGFTAGPVPAPAYIVDTDINMPADSEVTYTATCEVLSSAPPGFLTNTAVVASDGLQVEIEATDDDTLVVLVAVLDITKDDGEVLAVAGETTLTYTIVASNAGPSDVTDVSIADAFPGDLSCSFTAENTGTNDASGFTASAPVDSDIDDTDVVMPADSEITYTALCDVLPDAAVGTLENTATLVSVQGDEDTSATDFTQVVREAALSIAKTADPDPLVALGTNLVYTFTITNDGPSDADDLVINDTLPDGLVFTSTDGNCTQTLQEVTCTGIDVSAEAGTEEVSITVPIPENYELGPITNFARLDSSSSDTTDTTQGDDEDRVQTQVVVAVPAEGTAVIAVQKYFLDGNDETSVTLTLQCASGSYAPDTVTVNPDTFLNAPIGTMVEHTFVITNIPVGAPNPCTVVEQTVDGYDAVYVCPPDGSTSAVDDDLCVTGGDIDPIDLPESEACGWLDVTTGDSNLCVVLNIPAPVDVDVTKVWETFGAEQADFSADATIRLTCPDALGIVDGTQLGNGDWIREIDLIEEDGDFDDEDDNYIGEGTAEFEVIPNWYPTASDPDDQEFTECVATEVGISNNTVEVDESDCTDIEVEAGMGDECTITNTVFFEGIPTLNQYGMAIMVLLMLGVGFIGMRRLV